MKEKRPAARQGVAVSADDFSCFGKGDLTAAVGADIGHAVRDDQGRAAVGAVHAFGRPLAGGVEIGIHQVFFPLQTGIGNRTRHQGRLGIHDPDRDRGPDREFCHVRGIVVYDGFLDYAVIEIADDQIQHRPAVDQDGSVLPVAKDLAGIADTAVKNSLVLSGRGFDGIADDAGDAGKHHEEQEPESEAARIACARFNQDGHNKHTRPDDNKQPVEIFHESADIHNQFLRGHHSTFPGKLNMNPCPAKCYTDLMEKEELLPYLNKFITAILQDDSEHSGYVANPDDFKNGEEGRVLKLLNGMMVDEIPVEQIREIVLPAREDTVALPVIDLKEGYRNN